MGSYNDKGAVIAQRIAEQNRQKLNGRELAMLELLVMMHGMMHGRGTKDLEGLMRRSAPNGWVQFRQAMGILDKLLDKVYDAIPVSNLRMIDNMMRNGEVSIKLQRAGAYDDDLTIAPAKELTMVINCAMHAECAMCLKNRADIKRCELRRALDAINPPETFETTSCPYRDVVLASDKPGEYI